MIASLSMYDLPALRAETDALWAAIRDQIRARGEDAPEMLDRTRTAREVWTDPALVLSQTCGMPWRLGLYHAAQLVGTPDYGLEGCPPGYYCSAIVVRADDPRAKRSDFADGICAFNGPESQSGFAAWEGFAFAAWHETGAHALSISAVASGAADIAAIDAVTWRLAVAHQPEAAALRVLEWTKTTPGLPFITAQGRKGAVLAEAVTAGIAALDPAARRALGIAGFVQIPSAAYLAV
jgi:hypothetical protein